MSTGGAYEETPARSAEIVQNGTPALNLNAPLAAGDYRLFVYVLDRKGHAATANVPFQVQNGAGQTTIVAEKTEPAIK